MHFYHIPLTARIGFLIPSCKIPKIMSPQIKLYQPIKFFDNILQIFALDSIISLEFGKALKKSTRNNVIIDPGLGIMAHIETFPHFPEHQHTDIHGQLVIEIADNLLVIEIPSARLKYILLSNLQFQRYAITKRMHFLISPSSTRPFYSSQLGCICFQDEAVLQEEGVEGVLDGVGMLALVLHALEFLPVVSEENAQFYFKCARFCGCLLRILVVLVFAFLGVH